MCSRNCVKKRHVHAAIAPNKAQRRFAVAQRDCSASLRLFHQQTNRASTNRLCGSGPGVGKLDVDKTNNMAVALPIDVDMRTSAKEQ